MLRAGALNASLRTGLLLPLNTLAWCVVHTMLVR